MLKVSVVVATYRPGQGLDRLVSSLDAQTLSPSEYEVIFVDDGSPDDTLARLLEVQRNRPNVRVERIENSGWPSRPRNVGARLAEGEYVAYMDHDDELYPDALRSAYEFAQANGSDVVSGKEARTHDAAWAIDLYRRNRGQAVGMTEQHPMIPMNPHKLYRRAFLEEHDIRFPEGGRVMWEDIFFNLQVARRARVVSIMADTPYYHWFTTKGSGSTGFTRSSPDFWRWLHDLFDATESELAGDALQHGQLMAHQYRSRVIASFDTRFSARPAAERDLIYEKCRGLQSDFDLDRFDSALNSSGRLRAHLLRAGQRELLEELPHADPAIPGWGRAESLEWTGHVLRVRAVVDWSSPRGRRPALRRMADGRIYKLLPDRLAAAVPDHLRDMTDEISTATAELGMRSRESRVVWLLPSHFRMDAAENSEGRVTISATLDAELDLESAIFGRPTGTDTWDLNVRAQLGGSITQQPLRADLDPVLSMTTDGLHIAFVNKDDAVTVLADGRAEALRRLGPVASSTKGGHVLVTLDGRHTGHGTTAVTVGLDGRSRGDARFRESPAWLTVDGGTATLSFDAPSSKFRIRIGDRRAGAPRWWMFEVRGGAVTMRPGPATSSARPSPWPRLRRRVGRMLRRWGLRK
jgi:glycosyltransferase involved in cell wall biosynthesis